MANNRMSIRCTLCESKFDFFLAKNSGGGWYIDIGADRRSPEEFCRQFEEYCAKHAECDPRPDGIIPIGPTQFQLVYQITRDELEEMEK